MKDKNQKTNVMRILDREKIPYKSHFYTDAQGPEGTSEYGRHVAQMLGEDVKRVFKTLVASGASGNYYVYCVPAAESLDLKSAAKAVGEKSVELVHVAKINEITGYIRGGCSPIGMKKQYKTVIDGHAREFDEIFISAGKIGAQVEISPQGLAAAAKAVFAEVIA